ncbi:MAG: hypothetical protein MZV65_18720 [Chromatiales bacterium]|nr:hypothetical protein [Chromatiales bacterium]
MGCVERNGERWAEAELHRLRGRLLCARGMQDADGAEACFRKALDIARAAGNDLRGSRSRGPRGTRCTSATARDGRQRSRARAERPEATTESRVRASAHGGCVGDRAPGDRIPVAAVPVCKPACGRPGRDEEN